ncbi:hypothetical protein T492DRAFT_1005903, partial [Pavlovales sp. CCMP2436]
MERARAHFTFKECSAGGGRQQADRPRREETKKQRLTDSMQQNSSAEEGRALPARACRPLSARCLCAPFPVSTRFLAAHCPLPPQGGRAAVAPGRDPPFFSFFFSRISGVRLPVRKALPLTNSNFNDRTGPHTRAVYAAALQQLRLALGLHSRTGRADPPTPASRGTVR